MEANTALGDDGGGVWNMTQWFKSMILFLNNIKIWYTIYNLIDEKEYSHLYSLATQSVFWTNNYDIIFLHILQLSRFELHCMGPLTGRVFFFFLFPLNMYCSTTWFMVAWICSYWETYAESLL